MVIFFKTLAAYKTLLFPSLLSLKPFLDSLHTSTHVQKRTRGSYSASNLLACESREVTLRFAVSIHDSLLLA